MSCLGAFSAVSVSQIETGVHCGPGFQREASLPCLALRALEG
jgi:hypothetical protein